jgi:thiol:disulfide interchange protein DsbD
LWFFAVTVVALSMFSALSGPARAQAYSQPESTDNVTAQLHSARAAAAPGETFTIVLRQKLRDGWHTYWRNFGDSGGATIVTWTNSPGLVVGEMQFPPPKRIPVPPLMTYGYEGEILYPFTVRVPANARLGSSLTFSAKAETLVCSDTLCIPEDQFVNLTVPVAARGQDDATWAPKIAAALDAIPKPALGVRARITRDGQGAVLSVTGGPFAGVVAADAYFFPFDPQAILHSADQRASGGVNGFRFTLTSGKAGPLGEKALAGVVRIDRADGSMIAVEIAATPGAIQADVAGVWTAPSAPVKGAGASGADVSPQAPPQVTSVWMALLFAFIGGLILNVMPCVFPVLSMKALGLAKTAHIGDARRNGVLFFAGVMATFLMLAGVMMALSAAGSQVGWGFQLQEPLVVAALVVVFFLIGLNLLGLFEVGTGLQNVGANLANRGGDLGAFFTGALSVVAASPCTIPFMGGAVGFAAVATPVESLATFAALGAGFALPFTALAFAPGMLQRLPKPGPWMDAFKQAMAFPMFATAAWLVWVLASGAGANGALGALLAILAVSLLVWTWRTLRGSWSRSIGAGLAAAALAVGFWLLTPRPDSVAVQPWSATAVEALRADGKPVFVNFTAAWCVSCKANEWNALDRPAVQAAFAEKGVVYVKADWTRRDAAIAAELARYGRNGVPLYLYFPANRAGAPDVLPELLTEDILLSTLARS